jgi:hypothetical protein
MQWIILIMLNFCRFHSYCVDLTPEQVTNMDKYMCSGCAPENHKRASAPSHKTPDIKVMMGKNRYYVPVLPLHAQYVF